MHPVAMAYDEVLDRRHRNASRHDDFDPPIEMDPQGQPTRPRTAAQVEYRVGGVVGIHP